MLFYGYSYGFYMFFDFAGYSLMAIGTSYILGIKTPENFNKPFISKDIKEFWDRWHITLSHWFRDFVFSRFCNEMYKEKMVFYKTSKSICRFYSKYAYNGSMAWNNTLLYTLWIISWHFISSNRNLPKEIKVL